MRSLISLAIMISLLSFRQFTVSAQEDTLTSEQYYSGPGAYNDANLLLLEDKQYLTALNILQELLKKDPGNANLNYKTGLSLFLSTQRKDRALRYFEKALENVSSNYDMYAEKEKKAPVETYFYAASSYHYAYQLDKAIYYYTEFLNNVEKKHVLEKQARLQIKMCLNARELTSAPLKINPVNLGKSVNGKFPDFGPVLSADAKTIYFTSRRRRADNTNKDFWDVKDGLHYQDIYSSKKDEKGEWQKPEMLGFCRPSSHNGCIALSADGSVLYVYNNDEGNWNLFKSKFADDKWQEPEPLGPAINTKSNETSLTISTDGKHLYFISDRKGGIGGKDIYHCVQGKDGEWENPENMGAPINSIYDEDAVYIHPHGKILFFSSNSNKSMGGYDIFYCNMNDDGKWSSPKNIGYPINTTDDDLSIAVSRDGNTACFSSYGDYGGYGDKDIYAIENFSSLFSNLALVKGFINVGDNDPLYKDISVVVRNNATQKYAAKVPLQSSGGGYALSLPPGSDYTLSYQLNGNEFYNEYVYVPAEGKYIEVKKVVDFRALAEKFGGVSALKAAHSDSVATTQLEIVEVEKVKEKQVEVIYTEQVEKEVNVGLVTAAEAKKLGKVAKEVEKEVKVTEVLEKEVEVIKPTEVEKIVEKEVEVVKAEIENSDKKNERNTKSKLPPYYFEFYDYNNSGINPLAPAFRNFIDELSGYISVNKRVNIMIESSASRVPTGKYLSNETLARERGNAAQKHIAESLKKNPAIQNVKFAEINAIVTGPEYKNDSDKNKDEYAKHQYVKIFVE